MELKFTPVPPERNILERNIFKRPPGLEKITLHISMQFNECWANLPGPVGRVKFGLTSGELRLKLDNWEMPLEDRGLRGALESSLSIEAEEKLGQETQSSGKVAISPKIPGVESTSSEKSTEGQTHKFRYLESQVTSKGDSKNPAWVFEIKTGQPVLKGGVDTKLGTLHANAKPCHLEAIFSTTLKEIAFTASESFWLIPDEKQAILDRGLARLFLKHKLRPYLSKEVVEYA